MQFLSNFSLQSLFLVIVFGVTTNAIFSVWKTINANQTMTVAECFTLPEVKTLKQCFKFTFLVIVVYCLIKLINLI